MLKFILGATVVVGLVGYGVISTKDIETAGAHVRTGVNNTASWVKEKTDPTLAQQVTDLTK